MKTLLYCLMAGSLIAGCGGGQEGGYEYGYVYSPPGYGAIAVNKVLGSAGIVANYDSQRSANDAALKQCGTVFCEVALEIKPDYCGALARAGEVPTFGWGSDRSRSDAKSKAMSNCIANNGEGCAVVLDACND